MPSSRRRAATTKPKVLATTNIAMNSATPDIMPNIDGEVVELRASGRR